MDSTVIPELATIPPGEFVMGSDEGEEDERPAHLVHVDEFRIGVQPVTNAEYARFVKATGHRKPYHWTQPVEDKLPVFNVDWNDATAYCAWAGKRLPTEAEWERAARGGKQGMDYPWGNSIDAKKALYNVAAPGPVGQFPPNDFGLYDMAGGVSEWCSDWFERTYYEKSEPRNPKGPATGEYKIIRGGAWSDSAPRVTVFFRNWVRPNQRTPNVGFRCAK